MHTEGGGNLRSNGDDFPHKKGYSVRVKKLHPKKGSFSENTIFYPKMGFIRSVTSFCLDNGDI